MPVDRPTDYPDWASTAPAASIVEPPTSNQQLGFIFDEIPTWQLLNWFWNRVASWVKHLAHSVSQLPDTAAMWAVTVAGGGALLEEQDTALISGPRGRLGQSYTSLALVSTRLFRVSSSGRSVADGRQLTDSSGDMSLRWLPADDLAATPTVVFTNTGLGLTTVRLLNDGVQIVAAFGTWLYLFDHETGATVWSVNHGAIINDIAWTHDRVYIVSSKAATQLTYYSRSAGAAGWSYDHNAELFNVVAYGLRVYVHGAVSGHASAATMRAVTFTGSDAAGEGGLGTSTSTGIWDTTSVTGVSTSGLRTDGAMLFAWEGASGTVHAIDKLDGSTLYSRVFGAAGGLPSAQIDVDTRNVYIPDPTLNRTLAIDKASLAVVFWTEGSWAANPIAASSDDVTLWGGEDTVYGTALEQFIVGSGQRFYRYIDPTETSESGTPWRRAITPADPR